MLNQFKKTMLWLNILPFLPAAYFSGLKTRKLVSFAERYKVAQKWSQMVLRKSNTKLVVSGISNIPLQDGNLFAINHQGSMDGFVMIAAIPVPITAVSKIEGRKIPILGEWYDVLEVILFDRKSAKDSLRMVKEVAKTLTSGRNVVIFPEGTRSKSEKMGEFKPGALKPAYLAKAPIIPVALIDSYKVLDLAGNGPFTVKVRFAQPIHFEEYGTWSTQECSEVVKQRIQDEMDKERG